MSMFDRTQLSLPDSAPLGGSLAVGLVASLCCGGGLIFGAIGLGAFYSALGVSQYIPHALAGGAIQIGLMNWLYYRNKAARRLAGDAGCGCADLRRAMLLSGFMGLIMMAISFVVLEWLNHAVVNAGHFMAHHQYGGAVIPGVPNVHLGYLAATFVVLPLLAFLPFPRKVILGQPVSQQRARS